ncbi:MAG: FtsX-like permease family protein [Cyclobacteriaceae bacterium]
MLYFKLAYRHLLKNSTFSTINILGLTLGFLSFILIALYIHDELNFDQMHSDGKEIYRVLQHETMENGDVRNVAMVSGEIAVEARQQYPEVYDATRLTEFGRVTMGNDPQNRGYEHLIVADSNFFSFFDFKLLKGNPSTVLTQPEGIVITEKLAQKYFGTTDAMGKVVWMQDKDMFVAGIMEDFPTNSHIQFDLIVPREAVRTIYPQFTRFYEPNWASNSYATYLKLKLQSRESFERSLTALVEDNYPSDKDFRSVFTVQALDDIHLHSAEIQDYQINVSGFTPFYMYMFSAVAFLILLIASLNYMNLSTAAAFKRTREIGTRKTLGARKGSLIGQFLGEAILLCLISLALAVALAQIILPVVNDFTLKTLSLASLSVSWATIIGLTLIGCGVIASLYPAFIVSKVSPVDAIKREIKLANRSIPIRKILVIAQFAVSIIMISSTLIIYRQLNFVREKELGFDEENLVTVDINSGILRRQFETIKNEFLKIPEVEAVTVSSRVPGEWKQFPIASVNRSSESIGENMIFIQMDEDFLDTYKLKLLEGRNFSNNGADSTKVLLTRLAVEQLGLDNPIGQVVEIPQVMFGGRIRQSESPLRLEVIGVVEDFYFESLRKKMMPLVFGYHNNPIHVIDYYTLKVRTRDWNQTLDAIKNVNAKFDPNNPVEYNFLDSKIGEFYQSDARRGFIFLVFSMVIILIACMGLFALVSFSVENRKKEIGVRKVLGASAQSIVSLLSREFMKLVLVAFVIATPLVILTMNSWLSEFAYHVNINVGTFAISGVVSLFIAFATVSFRSIRAAMANPVDSLRSD